MLLRVRVSSFLAGFGLASAAAFFQLRNDITNSSTFLAAQVSRAAVVRQEAAGGGLLGEDSRAAAGTGAGTRRLERQSRGLQGRHLAPL
jgi:hypothetical protein